MAPRTLVTGAAGFIGSHLAEECRRLGHDVVGVDDLSGGFRANVPDDIEFLEIDCRDAERIDTLFAERRFDYVFHLAAYAAEGLSHFIRQYNYQVNLVGSMVLINAAINHGVRRFVFTSSIAAYGTGDPPYTENQIPRPEDPYGISKYAVELDLRAAHELFGLDYTIFRPFNVYGERQNIADAYRNVVCIFFNQALQGRPMTVFGDGEQTRAFSYIADVVPMIAAAASLDAARNEVFNVGAAVPYTIGQLAREVAAALGVEPRINHLPPRVEVVHARSSVEKATRLLGFEPDRATPLAEGLARMADWAREFGARAPVHFQSVEIERDLPVSWRTPGLRRRPRVQR